jgi:Skp family chaperone for outer membrane proteins
MEELLDGVQQELGSTVPAETEIALNDLRRRLEKHLTAPRRKRFKQELETLFERKPGLKAAANRYLRKKVPAAIAAAEAALEAGQELLSTLKRKKTRTWLN